jgi:hypothetical protein
MWLSEDPLEDIDSPNLYAFVAWGPQSGRDPMGLSDQPYNAATGTQAHVFFSRWLSRTRWYAARSRTGDVYLNKSVRIALRDSRRISPEALQVPFEWDGSDLIKVLASDLIRPDVAYLPFVSEELGEIYELKPITQDPAKGKAQLDLYVLFFEINDVSMVQGDFADVFPDSLGGFEIPGTVVDWDGQLFKIRISAPEVGTNSGLVNYELVPVDDEDYARASEQALDWALKAAPDFADRERGVVAAPIGFGGDIIVQPPGEVVLIGTGLAAAMTAIEAILTNLEAAAAGVPIIIIDPCVLDPHGPFCGPQQRGPGGA